MSALGGKVALITGTASGQGRAAALRFASEGALVVGCDVNAEGNDETVRLVRERGCEMSAMARVDLSDPAQAEKLVHDAAAVHGRIDVLYNNAAGNKVGTLEAISLDDWHFTMRHEIDLVFLVTKFAWPYLKASRGVVITTASVAGHRGLPGIIAHITAKGAVLAFSRALAVEGAPYGIRSMTISPGPIITPPTAEWWSDPEIRRKSQGSTLLDRLGDADEVARVAAFLASDGASFMTGCDVAVDGGTMAGRR